MPKAMVLGSYSPIYFDIFNFAIYHCLHYQILPGVAPPKKDQWLTAPLDVSALENHVLREIFSAEVLRRSPSRSSTSREIIELLSDGWTCFVPINKRECFYWDGYRTQDQAQLTAITEYEPGTDRFVTLDSEFNVGLLDRKLEFVGSPSVAGEASVAVSLKDAPRSDFLLPLNEELFLRDVVGDAFSQGYLTANLLDLAHKSFRKAYPRQGSEIVALRMNQAQLIDPISTIRAYCVGLEGLEIAGKVDFLLRPKLTLVRGFSSADKQAARYIASHRIWAKALIRCLAASSWCSVSDINDLAREYSEVSDWWRRLFWVVCASGSRSIRGEQISQIESSIAVVEQRMLARLFRILSSPVHEEDAE